MKKKVKTFLVNGKKVTGRQCNICYTKYHPSTKHNLTCKGPPELVTDENVGTDVEIENRKCRMASEVPEDMKLFKTYSRNGCIFNCMLYYRYVSYRGGTVP